VRYLGVHPSASEEYALAVPRSGREQAHAWLAQFATLLTNPASLGLEDARRSLELLRILRENAGATAIRLQAEAGPDDMELAGTLREAVGHLDVIEAELKSHLARVAPGDPEGMVDLAAIRSRMAKLAARSEVKTSPAPISHLKLRVPPMEPASRTSGMVVLCGYSAAWWALLFPWLLAMQASLFGAALFGLVWGALWALGLKQFGKNRCAGEEVILYGNNLVILRTFLIWRWKEEHRLAPDSRALHEENRLILEDDEGTPVTLARGRYRKGRMILAERINIYLNEA
jgi:hypothetical protein